MLIAPGTPSSVIVLVVDDSADDELTSLLATEDEAPSSRFGGLWGHGERSGNWLISFKLIELGGGIERDWFTDNVQTELLDAVLDVPHCVGIMPSEIAEGAVSGEDWVQRLAASLIVQVDRRSPQVAEVREAIAG